MTGARRAKRKAVRAAVVCDGSCHSGDLSAGAVLGAFLVGVLWLGLDQFAAVLIR